MRIQKALHALATLSPAVFAAPAAAMAGEALSRAQEALTEREYRLLAEIPAPHVEQSRTAS
jgi:hypothetical protein